jgi:hypothetical protein
MNLPSTSIGEFPKCRWRRLAPHAANPIGRIPGVDAVAFLTARSVGTKDELMFSTMFTRVKKPRNRWEAFLRLPLRKRDAQFDRYRFSMPVMTMLRMQGRWGRTRARSGIAGTTIGPASIRFWIGMLDTDPTIGNIGLYPAFAG